MKPLLTVHDAYEALGCDRWEIFRLLKSGELKGVRFGKAIRIPREHVEELLRRRKLEELEPELSEGAPSPTSGIGERMLAVSQKRALEAVLSFVRPNLPPVCLPVVSSSHTALFPMRTGSKGLRLEPGEVTREIFPWKGLQLQGGLPKMSAASARAFGEEHVHETATYLAEDGTLRALRYTGLRHKGSKGGVESWEAVEEEIIDPFEVSADLLWRIIARVQQALVEHGQHATACQFGLSLSAVLGGDPGEPTGSAEAEDSGQLELPIF